MSWLVCAPGDVYQLLVIGFRMCSRVFELSPIQIAGSDSAGLGHRSLQREAPRRRCSAESEQSVSLGVLKGSELASSAASIALRGCPSFRKLFTGLKTLNP